MELIKLYNGKKLDIYSSSCDTSLELPVLPFSISAGFPSPALDFVDIYIRNPRARYVSGVNTYLQHLKRDHPDLDVDTAFWFAKRYKFLNTHYLPQFHWIANLSQYLKPTAKIRFRNFQDFGNITDFQHRALVIPPTQQFVTKLLANDTALELWLYLDQLLLELAGQQLTWQEVIDHYKVNYPDVIAHVLPKT